MIPLPKPRFAAKKVPVEISPEKKKEYYEKLIAKQSHDIENAIDRVSWFYPYAVYSNLTAANILLRYSTTIIYYGHLDFNLH